MKQSLRYLIFVPLSVLAFYALFVLPDIDLGWPGGLAVLAAAWLIWYQLWLTLRASAQAAQRGELAKAAASPGEQGAWIGLLFTAAILVYFALRSPLMVAADGGLAPEATSIGRHIGMLVVGWLVVMQVLRNHWRDRVEADERDRTIEARANGWARGSISVFVVGLAVTFAFTPVERLHWAQPMMVSNLLMMGLVASCALEYAVTAVAYWRDRH
ncbi:MAG: hypothetical protein JSS45_08730 [Proteobacteria bacterium]|nr:hypothetical protein [Pseudomonadota bacterium]